MWEDFWAMSIYSPEDPFKPDSCCFANLFCQSNSKWKISDQPHNSGWPSSQCLKLNIQFSWYSYFRFCLIIFTTFTIVTTIAVLFSAPHILVEWTLIRVKVKCEGEKQSKHTFSLSELVWVDLAVRKRSGQVWKKKTVYANLMCMLNVIQWTPLAANVSIINHPRWQ